MSITPTPMVPVSSLLFLRGRVPLFIIIIITFFFFFGGGGGVAFRGYLEVHGTYKWVYKCGNYGL